MVACGVKGAWEWGMGLKDSAQTNKGGALPGPAMVIYYTQEYK